MNHLDRPCRKHSERHSSLGALGLVTAERSRERSVLQRTFRFLARISLLAGLFLCAAPKCGVSSVNPDNVCEERAAGVPNEALACASSATCPRGTQCVIGDGATVGTCLLQPYAAVPADALLQGFDVSAFDLVYTATSAGPTFSVRAPQNSAFLACGLFGCTPTMQAPENDPKHPRMVNASRCLLESRVLRIDEPDDPMARQFVLNLRDLEPVSRGNCSDIVSLNDFDEGADYPVVESLQVGCWAFSDAAVIGATRLIPLTPLEFPTYGDVPRDDCGAADADGRYCYQPPVVGACRQGVCDPSSSPDLVRLNDAGLSGINASCEPEAEGAACSSKYRPLGRCLNQGCVDLDVSALERPLVVSDCAPGNTDWLNCFPSQLGVMGTCKDDFCRVRCRVSADCSTLAETSRSLAMGPSDWQCTRAGEAQYLGVCEPTRSAP